MVYALKLIPRTMVDFLSLLGSKPLVLGTAFQMQKKDDVMGISLLYRDLPLCRKCDPRMDEDLKS
jgi:hypothetical protein